MADARQGIHRPREGGRERRIVAHPAQGIRHQAHGVLATGGFAAVADDGVHPLEAGRGLAQRPHGQQTAIAKAARPVHHHQFDVTGQGIVLQAVVGDDDVHLTALLQQPHSIGPSGGHRHGAAAAPCDEHGLIPGLGRGAALIQSIGVMGRLAAIAAADHARAPAPGLELFHQPDHHRGLAVAPHREIAHHHHRQGGPIGAEPASAIPQTADAADQGKQQGEGGQPPAPEAVPVPESGQHQPLLPVAVLPN